MHFGFVLELSDIDLWNTDFLDTHLNLLSRDKYTDIPVNILFVSIKSLRGLQDMSSRHIQDMSSRRLARGLQNVFTIRLQDVLEDVKLLRWRRGRLQDQQMFAG